MSDLKQYVVLQFASDGLNSLEDFLNERISPYQRIVSIWWGQRGCTIVLEARD